MKQTKKSRRSSNRIGIKITAVVLLILLALAGWKLTAGRIAREEDPGPAEETLPKPEEDASASEHTQKPETDTSTELTAAEQQASFLPDYTSAPLLNTTPIRCLSLEVGATADELRFNWLSPSASKGQVRWTNQSSGETQTFDAQCSPSTTVPGYYVNKASVTGFAADTGYTYQVGNDDGWSPEYSYHAPQVSDSNLTFLVTADAQIGQSEVEDASVTTERWDSVLNRLTDYVPEASFLFHVGDQVADYGSEEHYEMYLEHLPLYRIALAPAVGNHDVPNAYSMEENGHPGGLYFYEHFNVPNRSSMGQSQYDKDGNYYFIRSNVLFIVLNSSTSQGEAVQEQYVAQVVAEHPQVKWRILAQHYPAYPAAEDSHTGAKEYLARIAIDNDIDLVLGAHDHVYSRTAFVNRDCETYNDYDYEPGAVVSNPEGTMYVTCGTSSGCLYHFPEEEMRIVYSGQPDTPMAIRFDVTDSELHLRAYLMDTWTVYDEYTIQKD